MKKLAIGCAVLLALGMLAACGASYGAYRKASATVVDLPELISAYRDLAAAYVDGKRAQVNALNRTGLSLEEYRWTRSRVYHALGMSLMDVDVSRIVED